MNYDKKIMSELLKQDGVRENVIKMTAKELKYFKDLLVKPRGHLPSIYEQYCQERKDK